MCQTIHRKGFFSPYQANCGAYFFLKVIKSNHLAYILQKKVKFPEANRTKVQQIQNIHSILQSSQNIMITNVPGNPDNALNDSKAPNATMDISRKTIKGK